ncbi:NAD(P)H-dependent oxidoreductase [Flavihumibacter rivuli]|uniref:NAD(P)H-dependent oxidoreductase n=1 Tax=Flavihumibacter rivuli TaxID=2838156 RepID=UPI001BDE1622|nr:NAD(P)H-dependent oxidoreductase [Flavihumibacter rivuli]ULQ58417.1 NAD(P)H-dependent oxidoreductase [Flavihumibacter rivuli]
MKKILVISAHPNISYSTANRVILEELANHDHVEVMDIMKNYPDGQIDIAFEQKILEEADALVIQSPMIWYNLPSHARNWLEKVMAYGYAHGPGGDRLKQKPVLLSFTLGGSREAYTREGLHGNPVEHFLLPTLQLFRYCGANVLPPLYSYSMSAYDPAEQSKVEKAAREQARQILEQLEIFAFQAN